MSLLLEKYNKAKESIPAGTILLMRVGDFYEAFNDDAKTLSKSIGSVLTKRKGVPMSGVPYHSIERTIKTLVNGGLTVATLEVDSEML